jgi:hypothetical protein
LYRSARQSFSLPVRLGETLFSLGDSGGEAMIGGGLE